MRIRPSARQAMAGFDIREEGLYGGPPLTVYGSSETHSWIGKAYQRLGETGAGKVIRVGDIDFIADGPVPVELAITGQHAPEKREELLSPHGHRIAPKLASHPAGSFGKGGIGHQGGVDTRKYFLPANPIPTNEQEVFGLSCLGM